MCIMSKYTGLRINSYVNNSMNKPHKQRKQHKPTKEMQW